MTTSDDNPAQLCLFELGEPKGWVRHAHGVPGSKRERTCKLFTWWTHHTGWRVEHCGHPTANWPYAVISPEGELCVAPHGRGFRRADSARDAVDLLLLGYAEVRDGRIRVRAEVERLAHEGGIES